MKLRVGGTPVKSMETRWLHQDHAQALRELREHRQRCIECQKAARKRNVGPCAEGKAIHEAEQELLRQAREADQADVAPNPAPAALFDLEEVGAPAEPLEPRKLIHRHLMDHPGLTITELAVALRMKPASVSRQLSLMEDDGEAEQVSDGHWEAT